MKNRFLVFMAAAGSLLLAATGSVFAAGWGSPLEVTMWSTQVKPGITYAYPATQVGVRLAPVPIVITNRGKSNLSFVGPNPITVSGQAAAAYSVQEQPRGVLAPGESTSFNLGYAPTSAGRNDALVTIRINDKAMPTFSFEVGSMADQHPSGAGSI